MLFAVVVFPGSNCDHDVYHVAKHVLGCAARYVWHKDRDLRGADVVVLPGGFSYGDYLRTGAIARFSPIMEEIRKFAHRGGHVVGICNGFQILLEAGLLPGAMRRNDSLKYVCRDVHLKVENAMTPWTRRYAMGDVIRIPIDTATGTTSSTTKDCAGSRASSRSRSGTSIKRVSAASRAAIRTGRWRTLPGSPTRAGTSSG